MPKGFEAVVFVHELQPCIEAEHGRDHRKAVIGGLRSAHDRADEVREAQGGDAHLRAPAREAAYIALDLDGILRPSGGRRVTRLGLLSEHRGILRTASVHRRGRLHDEGVNAGSLLAGGKQLHGADDVDFLHRRSTAGLPRGRQDTHVHHGVDSGLAQDLGDHGAADIGAHEVDGVQRHSRCYDIDADDPIDTGVRGEEGGHLAA